MSAPQKVVSSTVERAIRMLDACHVHYKVILPDGTEHGELPPPTPAKPQRRTRGDRPFGALSKHIKPYLNDEVKPGDVLVIPFGEFHPRHVRGAVSAYLSTLWGRGSYTTATSDTAVEVLRLH
jgi:hypothetical protein